MDTLAAAEWLNRRLDEPDPAVLDCTVCMSCCGGGIMASSTAFVMTLPGVTDGAIYTASLEGCSK